MTGDNCKKNAADEWALSCSFLAACDHLGAADMYHRATSQLYFAVFHAVRALLFTEGLEPCSHKGARHLLNVHFVNPGRVDREHMRLLQQLQDEREVADYSTTYPNDEERFAAMRARADETLELIHRVLGAAGVETG